jgi:hypothetical protein
MFGAGKGTESFFGDFCFAGGSFLCSRCWFCIVKIYMDVILFFLFIAITMGVNYDVFRFRQTRFAWGTHFTFFSPDKQLASLYGQNPISGQVSFRIFPGMMGTGRAAFFFLTKTMIQLKEVF